MEIFLDGPLLQTHPTIANYWALKMYQALCKARYMQYFNPHNHPKN